MKMATQNMIQNFTAIGSQKDELEFRDMSELKTLLTFLTQQDSISDVEIEI